MGDWSCTQVLVQTRSSTTIYRPTTEACHHVNTMAAEHQPLGQGHHTNDLLLSATTIGTAAMYGLLYRLATCQHFGNSL